MVGSEENSMAILGRIEINCQLNLRRIPKQSKASLNRILDERIFNQNSEEYFVIILRKTSRKF